MEAIIKSPDKGPVIEWLKAQKNDADPIASLVKRTIMETYPKYYPTDVVQFFCLLHKECRIREDIEKENVWMLLWDGKLVGTGSAKENHITRVYVLPEAQGHGFGSRIVAELEGRIKKNYDTVELDASIPAENFYERRGYRKVRQEVLSMGEMTLSYKVMEKVLPHDK